MSEIATLRALGLMTDAPAVGAPQGALRRAENVHINEFGVVSARNSIEVLQVPGSASSLVPYGICKPATYADAYDPIIWDIYDIAPRAASASASKTLVQNGSQMGSDEPYPFYLNKYGEPGGDSWNLRGNYYWNTSTGVFKLEGSSASTYGRVGFRHIPPGIAGFSSATTGAYGANQHAGYRWIFTRRDANNVLHVSDPSPMVSAVMFGNVSAANDSGVVSIPIPIDVVAGDTVELYRSAIIGDTLEPSQEMKFVTSTRVSASHITAGYVNITDSYSDAKLGQTLYTSPSQADKGGPNLCPPASVCGAVYANCVWLGGVRLPHRIDATYKPTTDGRIRWVVPATCTFTSATTMTVSSATDITPGQLMWRHVGLTLAPGNGTTLAAASTVVSVVGTTVTFSPAASVSAGAYTDVVFSDYISVAGQKFYAHPLSTSIYTPTNFNYPYFLVGNATPGGDSFTMRTLAAVVSNYDNDNTAIKSRVCKASVFNTNGNMFTGDVGISFERYNATDGSFSISSNRDVFEQFAFGDNGDANSYQDTNFNKLYYSKEFQPEHFSYGQYFEIGEATESIIALVPISEALLVFTDRNIYRVSGNQKPWTVDTLATNVSLYHRRLVDVMDGAAYALTTRGALRITPDGIENISSGKIGNTLEALTATDQEDIIGSFAVCMPHTNIVLFAIREYSSGLAYATKNFVYNVSSQAWTTWEETRLVSGVYDPFTNKALVGTYGDGANYNPVCAIPALGASYYGSTDSKFLYTNAATYSIESSYIFLAKATWNALFPKVGDTVNGILITGVDSVLHTIIGPSWRLLMDAEVDSGPLALFKTIESVVEWQAHTVNAPVDTALFTEMHAVMDYSADGITSDGTAYTITLGGATNMSDGRFVTDSQVNRASVNSFYSVIYRYMLSSSIARASHFYPYFACSDTETRWKLNSIALVCNNVGNRSVIKR